MPSPHNEDSLDLPPDLMREMGYAAIDRLIERITTLDDAPAWRGTTREEMRRRLEDVVDTGGGADFGEMVDALFERVLAYGGSTDHPRFFAFIPSSGTWPAILGDLLASGSGTYPGTWIGGSGYQALELEVLGWFRDWIGYPPESAGLLMSGGSMANLTALVAAREAMLGAVAGAAGGAAALDGPDVWGDGVIYTSSEAHSSVLRAARILGFASNRVRVLETDDRFRLPVDALAAAVEADRAKGLRPFYVAANAGATSTGAIDPLPELADFCEREGLWLHVDAAYGGFAILTDRGRDLLAGLDRAHSVTLDPHKWLFQPFEAGCLMVRDGRPLVDAFRIMPDYMQDTAVGDGHRPDDAEVNFADRGPQLTRGARAIKIWLSVRYYGLDRLRDAIARGMELADRAEAWIRESGEFEILSPATLGVVCFRARGGEAENEARLRRLRESGVGFISSTRVRGEFALRICVMGHRSSWEDVVRVLEGLGERG